MVVATVSLIKSVRRPGFALGNTPNLRSMQGVQFVLLSPLPSQYPVYAKQQIEGERSIHRHRLETLQRVSRTVGDWIHFYSHERPHQALGIKTPSAVFKLAG